jgi:serine/threonine protein kinase
MAPEITNHFNNEITNKELLFTTAIDMWSFGVVLFEMCVGYNPTIVYRNQIAKLLGKKGNDKNLS